MSLLRSGGSGGAVSGTMTAYAYLAERGASLQPEAWYELESDAGGDTHADDGFAEMCGSESESFSDEDTICRWAERSAE